MTDQTTTEWVEATLQRYVDQYILADTRIAAGNAETLEEWMRWHSGREHAALMIGALELRLRILTDDARPFSDVPA